jgi:multisubunit Na+/H+ antiporter MnhB subunit
MPWYARGGTTASILIGSLLISLAVLLIRLGAWIAGRLRKSGKVNSPQLRAARWLSTLHAGLLILMLAMLAGTGMPHPVYQLPLSAFGEYNMVNSLLGFMPYLLTLLGAMLLLVAVQASGQGAWRPGTRLLLGIQAFFGVGLIWLFWFYHMFSW